MESSDILVLGGGIAGVAAALAASATGARVTLVRAAPGATALSTGAWFDAPPPALRVILDRHGLTLTDCDDALPHPDGRLVRCACADESHARASISGDVLVVGIAGLPGFRANPLARLWRVPRPGLTITLPDTPAGGWSPASLAASIERAPQAFGDTIRTIVSGATRVILPAVLGVSRSVHREVSAAAGVTVTEALGGTPSLPGWRIDGAMLRALAEHGINVVHGRVTDRVIADSRVQSVSVGATSMRARTFVLATGKYFGGGIGATDRFTESALDCDVSIQRFGRAFDDPAESLSLTDPVRTEPQPILGVGVRVDVSTRPVSARGDVLLHNVFVAGSVRADVETAAFGLGAAAHEGWNAGVRATSAGG